MGCFAHGPPSRGERFVTQPSPSCSDKTAFPGSENGLGKHPAHPLKALPGHTSKTHEHGRLTVTQPRVELGIEGRGVVVEDEIRVRVSTLPRNIRREQRFIRCDDNGGVLKEM